MNKPKTRLQSKNEAILMEYLKKLSPQKVKKITQNQEPVSTQTKSDGVDLHKNMKAK